MSASSSALYRKRILVTRPKEQASAFSKKIAHLGGIPIEIPLINIQAPKDTKRMERVLNQLHLYDWVILTSVNGVRYFFDFVEKWNVKQDCIERLKFAVVGKKTLQALEKRGFSADLVPDQFVGESLLEKLTQVVAPHESILLIRGNLARPFLRNTLKQQGFHLEDLVVYETVLHTEGKKELIHCLQNNGVDIITFTSPSAVTNFVKLLEGVDWQDWLKNVQIACIGPITEKAAQKARLGPVLVAEEYTIDGLLDTLVKANEKGDLQK